MFARKFCVALSVAVGLLLLIGCQGQKTTEDLVHELNSSNPKVRQTAALNLSKEKYFGPIAVRGLIQAIADSDPTVRRNAVWSLGEIKNSASNAATGPLIRNLNQYPELQQDTCLALGKIGDQSAAKFLIFSLYEDIPFGTDQAMDALIKLGPDMDGQNRAVLNRIINDPATKYVTALKAEHILRFYDQPTKK